MIELKEIKLHDHPPGIAGWLAVVRFIDESKGSHETEFGPLFNYDKSLALIGHTLDAVIESLETSVTELLSADN